MDAGGAVGTSHYGARKTTPSIHALRDAVLADRTEGDAEPDGVAGVGRRDVEAR
jgi:hypothetical protein